MCDWRGGREKERTTIGAYVHVHVCMYCTGICVCCTVQVYVCVVLYRYMCVSVTFRVRVCVTGEGGRGG